MNEQSIFAIRHWQLPEILFVGVACFAMAAVGFFVAVFLQLNWGPQSLEKSTVSSQLVPIEDKEDVMRRAAESSPQPQNIPSDNGNQSDAGDQYVDEKLKLLERMRSQ